jgi:hypothetical protein
LHHVLLELFHVTLSSRISEDNSGTHNVCDQAFPNIDASRLLAIGMSIPELRNNGDGVQACVFGQSGRDDLERFGESGKGVAFESFEGLSVRC